MHRKNKFIIKAKAKQDLDEIYAYSFREFGLKKTEEYVEAIDLAINAIVENWELGFDCNHVRSGYRICRVSSHLIFYKILNKKIVISRILHRSRDYAKHILC